MPAVTPALRKISTTILGGVSAYYDYLPDVLTVQLKELFEDEVYISAPFVIIIATK